MLKIAKNLEEINPDASASMLEGLEETCTILKFNLHKQLIKTLMSTNPLESMFSITGNIMKRVKRWKGNDMRKRWMVASALESEKRLRCVMGYKYLPDLKKAMQTDQEKRFEKLEISKEVA